MLVFIDVFKSITSLRPCIIITYVIFLISIINSMESISQDKYKEIIADLPKARDLNNYLTALENVVDFCVKHKVYVDLNMEFGLFLVNVNLKNLLIEKNQSLPSKAIARVEQLLMKNKILEDYFHYMVERSRNIPEFQQDIKISKIFYNDSLWPSSLFKFNTDLLAHTRIYTPQELEKIYGKWETYGKNVYNFDGYKPTPNESDECIAYLLENPPTVNVGATRICLNSELCKRIVRSGSEFGYGLTHRLLFLMVARFNRGCSVFSAKEDKYKVDKLCMRSFNEAQYIAANEFKLADLMLEQMVLCGLFGHAQFYRSSWISKLLEQQTIAGCFTEASKGEFNTFMRENENEEWKLSDSSQSMMGGMCGKHVTAVAASVLSAALRYIMETYY